MEKITINKKDLYRVMCQRQSMFTVPENLKDEAEEYVKKDLAKNIGLEMLENGLIDFKETITPEGYKKIQARVVVYKKSED